MWVLVGANGHVIIKPREVRFSVNAAFRPVEVKRNTCMRDD